MAELLRPNVAIVTMIGLEHKSTWRNCERIADAKAELVAAVEPGGFVVLNADDEFVIAMAARTRERIVTFGRSADAKYQAVEIRCAFPDRLRVKTLWPGGTLVLQTRFVGEHFWLPTLAAVATAMELGVPAEVVAERVATFDPLFARFSVLTVPGGPTFLVDTVKAPWYSLPLAFDTVAQATATRKRIVLGHLSDFAGSDSKYRDAYRLAAAVADQVVFVGNHAHRSKASREDLDTGRFLAFTSPGDAAGFVRATSIPGELILLKGSQDLHLERIALSILHDVKCWKAACQRRVSCQGCGLYEYSYNAHRGRRAKVLT
jgi:UDP-N-acetylmuramoyl-tripeptide--D-alanyl-D-alanine ligase